MLERPSLHALAVFLAVVEHGTMTAAAEAEGISQPAISAQVKSLERFFGTPLLHRNGRRVAPTTAGNVVADYSRRMLRMADDLNRAIVSLDSLKSGRLSVGASTTAGEQLLPEVLGTFHRSYPGVDLTLRVGSSADIAQAVRGRSLDIGIISHFEENGDLVSRPVFDDHLEIFVSPESRYANWREVPLGDLSSETFVLRERGSSTHDLALRCLGEGGCTPARVIELGSNEAVKRAVTAGLGIGVLSVHTTRVDYRAGKVALLHGENWDCRSSFWLIHRRDSLLSRAEQAFLDLL